MRLTLPLTGTVLVGGTLEDGHLTGSDDDPIRPVGTNLLGNVSWHLVSVDLDNEICIVEVEPPELTYESSGGEDSMKGNMRPASREEKAEALQHAQNLVIEHTRDELYQMSGCSRLKRPFRGENGSHS